MPNLVHFKQDKNQLNLLYQVVKLSYKITQTRCNILQRCNGNKEELGLPSISVDEKEDEKEDENN